MPKESPTDFPNYVVLIESAYRGLLEEQYADVVWLTESVQRMGAKLSLILKDHAVLHAAAVPDHHGLLEIAGRRMDRVGNIRESIKRGLAAGVACYVDRDDWRRLASADWTLQKGIRFTSRVETFRLIARSEASWYW